MKRIASALSLALLLAGCGGNDEPNPAPGETAAPASAPTLAQAPFPPQVADFPALASKDCAEVARFYSEAIGSGEFARAALVWSDPVIDGAWLEALFGGYREPRIEEAEPQLEGAAGSLYCTVPGTLTDAADPAKPAIEGVLTLKRVNDVPGATAEQLRWTLRSSTFVEPIERSNRG